jgi:hypothetical protein
MCQSSGSKITASVYPPPLESGGVHFVRLRLGVSGTGILMVSGCRPGGMRDCSENNCVSLSPTGTSEIVLSGPFPERADEGVGPYIGHPH